MEAIQNQPTFDLPMDLVFEVLTRVSLETLEQCKLASEEINSGTNLSHFMNLYCERTNTFSGYIVQAINWRRNYSKFIYCGNPPSIEESLSLKFLPEQVRIEAVSSNEGLLYCESLGTSKGNTRCYVCKPTTGEWMKIRNPKTRFVTQAIAMVVLQTRPLHYLIIRFSKPSYMRPGDFTMFCEIFDSAMGRWKRSKNINFCNLVFFIIMGSPIYSKGVMHWLTSTREIFAFNVKRESWELIPLPEEVLMGGNRMKLAQHKGNLALFEYKSDRAELWVMKKENYTRQIWNKIEMGEIDMNAIDLYATDVVVLQKNDGMVVYNCTNRTFNTVHVTDFFYCDKIFPFKSDCEPVFLESVRGIMD